MKGSIRRRGDRWRLRVDVGRDPASGRRIQHTETFRRKADAEDRLAELIGQVNKGMFTKPAKLSVAEYLRQWLRDYAEPNTRPRTFENYRSKLERHAIPAIGHHPLAGLRPDHLQAL